MAFQKLRPRIVSKLRPKIIRPNKIGLTKKKCRGTVPLPCKKNGWVNNDHPVKISEEPESDKMISFYQHHCHCSPDNDAFVLSNAAAQWQDTAHNDCG